MDVEAKDCRLDSFRDALESYWLVATHLPTGVTVERRQGSSVGLKDKGRLMEKLQAAVNRHMNAESAETPEQERQCLVYFRLLPSETRGSLISFQDERAKRQVRKRMAS